MRLVSELYNKHENRPIWIVGAGPSIDAFPNDFMDNKLAIVLHNAYLKFPNAQYCHANELDRVRWFKENRPEYLDKICIFGWPFYRKTQWEVEEVIDPDRDNYYFFIMRPAGGYSRIVDWIEERIIEIRGGTRIDFGGYGTCLHACMYVCILMGCNPINIIGCEHKAEEGKDEYFGAAQEASKNLFKRNHVELGPMQEPSTRALVEACGRQNIKVNRYFSYQEVRMESMSRERRIPLHEFNKIAEFIPGPEPEIENLRIPVCEPDLRGNEKGYVLEAINSTWISSRGKFLDEFEEAYAEKVGAKYAIAVNSGTNALYLAAAALGIEKYDEVIMPTFTMISTINSITYLNAVSRLVDSDEYWQMDVDQIEKWITKDTRAIMPVHIYGHSVKVDRIQEIAEKYNLRVIYDAAEAQGAEFEGRLLGEFGDAVCYSFYGNKILTTGEGGMVVTNNLGLAEILRNLKDVAFSKERHFWHKRLGYNFRMTNLAAAVGLAQVERFDELVEAHRRNAFLYKERLDGVLGITTPPEAPWAKNVYWMFGVLVDQKQFGMNRDHLRVFLAEQGIETRTFFVPIHFQPYYFLRYVGQRFPIAEQLCRDGMYLPSSSLLTEEQIDYICDAMKEAHEISI